jgi:Nuclear transport factor 2 (NTF2) domain
MAFSRADMLAAVERSPAAAGAHDRDGWIGLFTADGRVEDPVGSRPHRGTAAIARFYDTFIGPRDITFHRDVDIVVGATVIRDLQLEVMMASELTMRIPAYLRYDLENRNGELEIAALQAFWELPAMVGHFLRNGVRAVPAGVDLSRALLRNQGLGGTLGFISGFRGIGAGSKGVFARFLDAACDGDEVGMRRRLARQVRVSSGDDLPLSGAELTRRLTGGRWHKMLTSGYHVVAAIERDGQRSVVVGEVGSESGALKTIQVFSEAG